MSQQQVPRLRKGNLVH